MKRFHAQAKASHERQLDSLTGGKPVELGKQMASEPVMKVSGTVEGSHQVMRNTGGKPKARLDRFARGGKVKDKGKTTVNVVIGAKDQSPPMPVPVPVGGPGGAPPMPPPHPPMMPPQGMPPGAPPMGGPPPQMPMMGRKRGGKVTQKDHKDKIQDEQLVREMVKPNDIKASAPGKRASGGRVGKFTAGAGSGEGRLEKAAHERRAR